MSGSTRQRRKVVRLLKRDGFNCHLCNKPLNLRAENNAWDQPSVDHVIPRKEGGGHGISNLRLAHRSCNSRRGHAPLVDSETCDKQS